MSVGELTRHELFRRYAAALQREHHLEEQVRGKGPNTPDFDPAIWALWLAAMRETNEDSRAMRAAFSSIVRSN